MCIFLILAPTEDFEEPIDVPADTVEIDEDSRLLIRKKYSTSKGSMSPYFGNYIGGSELTAEFDCIVLPLCDGSHFNGYIIDMRNKHIVFVDSMYQMKDGKRSVIAKLNDTYFNSATDVTYSSYYGQRVQYDSYSCGAWLISGFSAYILGIKKDENVLNMETIFNLLMVLIDNLDIAAKKQKLMNIFKKNIVVPQKRKIARIVDNDDNDIFGSAVNPKVKARKKYAFDECSDDENEQDLLFDTSTPLKNNHHTGDQLRYIGGSISCLN